MKRRKYLALLRALYILVVLAFTACEEVEVLAQPKEQKEVILLFSRDGLGDMSYYDAILQALLSVGDELDYRLLYDSPREGELLPNVLGEWLDYCRADDDRLLVIAGSEYEPFVRAACRPGDPVNDRVMLFEIPPSADPLPVCTLYFSAYEVSRQAGIMAYNVTHSSVAGFIGGQRGEAFVEEALEGFAAGFKAAGGETVLAHYLSDDADGFAMPDRAYELAAELFGQVPVVYPVAGGSNMGIYRYQRETATGYSFGMDVDQSHLSDRILASVIKRMDICLHRYIKEWMDTGKLPAGGVVDMQDGMIELRVATAVKL